MRYLFVNTAVSVSSVALIEDRKVVSIAEEKNSNDLSSKIFFMIDKVFQDGKCKPQDLNKIFVVTGPGSFTGIRIGLAIAKTMAWTLKIDLIPISTLEMLATSEKESTMIVSLIDARRNYVYAGVYDHNLSPVIDEQYILLDDLLEKISSIKTVFVSYDHFENLDIKTPTIDYLKIISKHENDIVVNCHSVNPVYLKLTEAEEKRIENK